MIGDFLYGLKTRDQASVGHEFYIQNNSLETTSADLAVLIDFPDDRILFAAAIYARAKAGLAQTSQTLTISIFDLNTGGGAQRDIWESNPTTASQFIQTTLLPGGMILAPPRSIQARGIFSGLTNANRVDITIVGYTLPRGNFVV